MAAESNKNRPLRGRNLPKAHYIAHVVKTGRSSPDPACGSKGPTREKVAIGRPMGELEALAKPCQKEGVLADHVATAQREHADLARGARSDLTRPSVYRSQPANLGHALGEAHGRSARRVDLAPMVHLHHLRVETLTQKAGGLCREVKEHSNSL